MKHIQESGILTFAMLHYIAAVKGGSAHDHLTGSKAFRGEGRVAP